MSLRTRSLVDKLSAVLAFRVAHTEFLSVLCWGTRREANPMKQLALEVVARTLDPAQISLLAEEFDRADTNHNGEVSAYQCRRCFLAEQPLCLLL